MFCQEYLVDQNATQAAIRAGYSEKTAGSQSHALLQIHEIQQRIEELNAMRLKRVRISADLVLTRVLETIDRCAQAVPVLDADGNETGEYVFKENGVLKGLELLGKNLKLFTERVESGGIPDSAPIKVENTYVSDKEAWDAYQRIVKGDPKS